MAMTPQNSPVTDTLNQPHEQIGQIARWFGEDGQPIFNEQRKIMKGPRYRSSNLAAYTVRRTHRDD